MKGVEPRAEFDDLRPLKEIFARVRVVGLGEATHGTREFFLLKHRLLEFLVEEMGFAVFGIESDHAACLAIDRYVLHGEGDAAEALAGQRFWTWNTEEVLDMIRWMRERNRSVPERRKVKFLGFDAQDPGPSAEALAAYLRRAASERAGACETVRSLLTVSGRSKVGTALARAVAPLRLALGKAPYKTRAADARRAIALAGELVAFLSANEKELVRRTSEVEFEEAAWHARTLAQSAAVKSRFGPGRKRPEHTAHAVRDLYMARNVRRILDAEPPGTKMVVWAHNGHVSKSAIFGGVSSMGRHLRDAFGQGYYSVGLTFDQGSFQAIRFGLGRSTLVEYTVGPAVEGSVERCLARAGLGDCLIDLRRAREDKGMRASLSEKRPMRSIGAAAPWLWKHLSYVPTALAEHYDGLVFVGETTRARPVRAF